MPDYVDGEPSKANPEFTKPRTKVQQVIDALVSKVAAAWGRRL